MKERNTVRSTENAKIFAQAVKNGLASSDGQTIRRPALTSGLSKAGKRLFEPRKASPKLH